MKKRLNRFVFALLVFLFALSCGGGGEDSGSSTTGDSSEPAAFTHKMLMPTGAGQSTTLAYECPDCTFAQWLDIVPPPGWRKGPAQVTAFSSGDLRSRPSFEGVPDDVDFIEEVPGNEYQLIAKVLDTEVVFGHPLGISAIQKTQVMRDSLFRYDAGQRVHELTDPDGNVYVLFAYEVDPRDVVIPDFQDPDLLSNLTIRPDDWTYASRVLEEELLLDIDGIATVLAYRIIGYPVSSWQMR